MELKKALPLKTSIEIVRTIFTFACVLSKHSAKNGISQRTITGRHGTVPCELDATQRHPSPAYGRPCRLQFVHQRGHSVTNRTDETTTTYNPAATDTPQLFPRAWSFSEPIVEFPTTPIWTTGSIYFVVDMVFHNV